MNRQQMLDKLSSLSPMILNPMMSYDMGLECTIATNQGVVYSDIGMMLFNDGNWPIRKISPEDKEFTPGKDAYYLRIEESNEKVYWETPDLVSAFVKIFNVDTLWEEMDDEELSTWIEDIFNDGISLVHMSEIWENEIINNTE